METREPHLHNGLAADMDKAEACGALKLTAADATDEDGSPQPVSEILQRIWDVCEFIDSSHFRVLPCQLAKHLDAIDPRVLRQAFPEVPEGGLEGASGRVSLLIGQDNLRLFPTEVRRVGGMALFKSQLP